MSIHRTDCVNIVNLPLSERPRLIEAEWQGDESAPDEKYMAEISIFANDRKGLLVDVSKVCTENNISINSINSKTSKQGVATLTMTFEIGGKTELNKLIDKINNVEGIIEVKRNIG